MNTIPARGCNVYKQTLQYNLLMHNNYIHKYVYTYDNNNIYITDLFIQFIIILLKT